jgi:membrane protein YdbS with pleckstrin-like domain
MTEIPVAEPGPSGEKPSEQPMEVKIAVVLLLVNALLGLFAGTLGLAIWEDATSAVGFLLAVFALWIARGLWNMEEWAWNWAVIINIVAIPLYLLSIFWLEGTILSILTLVYLNIPAVKESMA